MVYHNSEIAKLNGFYNLIRPSIKKYRSSVIPVTVSSTEAVREYNPNFTLNDMMSLYGSTQLLTQNPHEPAVKFYFASLELINKEFVDLIKKVDMRIFPQLESYCLLFIDMTHTFDFSNAILAAEYTTFGDKKMTDYVRNMLKNHVGEVEFIESNLINGYIALYHQIKLQMSLLDNIDTEFSEIIKNR